MTGKSKPVIRRVALLVLVAVFGIYLILYGSGALENSTGELALPTIHTTGTLTEVSTTETVVATATATETLVPTATIGPSGEWTVNDTTPNYDPNDPYGVKFGMAGMGIILLFVLINGLFGLVFKSKGGGGS